MNLTKTKDFDERFMSYLQKGLTRFEAYVATELDYKKTHNVSENKYRSFKSFDNSWYERLKRDMNASK